MRRGLRIVFTGRGKGKTTAALGMALRAAGHGMKVCFIQFIKGGRQSGELAAFSRFTDIIDVHVMGRGFTWKSEDPAQDTAAAREGWELARQAITARRYDMVVLDEFTYALIYNMVPLSAALEVLAGAPPDLHVVITGRDAPKALLDAADLVTEMRAVKHPFLEGIRAQKGVEF